MLLPAITPPHVSGEEAATVDRCSQAEQREAAGEHQDGIERLGQYRTIDQQRDCAPTRSPEQGAHPDLPGEPGQQRGHVGAPVDSEELHHRQRQEHGHRVVAARLDLQR